MRTFDIEAESIKIDHDEDFFSDESSSRVGQRKPLTPRDKPFKYQLRRFQYRY